VRRLYDWPIGHDPAKDSRLMAGLDLLELGALDRMKLRDPRGLRQIDAYPRDGLRLLFQRRQFDACPLACACATNSANFAAVIPSKSPLSSLPKAWIGTPIFVWPVSTIA